MPQEATRTERQATAVPKAESHRYQDILAVAAVTIGLAALIMGWIPATHLPGAIAGVIGLPLALYSQMISATTNERWLNVIGMVASFMGTAFALNNGGFSI
ncbi:hypothetical protein BZB76_0783 [Actinomadura pelletieri DSM 43383]|uniref:SPW repeat-containing protein n=1 Tax=Actinomadura pelletieri DSM 43383 TaxID=1120940 RepID=A0A495QYU5_9ACTN|nr:hypothetical protein [Actinomadura pelletieri]RKS79323.1 hypothetical protein BZB76_0783 [Actinomadura pelletieri DSM 43383]